MPWNTSNRRRRLPKDWPRLRLRVLREAGFRCEIRGTGCAEKATDVDHVRRGDDHSRGNLRAACSVCHGRKSSAEGVERQRVLRAARLRPVERHPGGS